MGRGNGGQWGAEREAAPRDGAAPRGGLRGAPRCQAPDPVRRLLQTDPGARAGPCGRCRPPVLGDTMAETPRRGLAGSRFLGQGRVAMSVSRTAEQAGVGAGSGQSLSRLCAGGRKRHRSGLLPAGWEPRVRQGTEGRGRRGKGSQASCKLLLTKIPFKRQRLIPLQHPAPQQSGCAAAPAPRGSRGLAHSTR